MLSISVDGLSDSEQREQLERFAEEVAPILRREVPSSVWSGPSIRRAERQAIRQE
ncbi:hypothetical protein JOC55_003341 [Paenibacillus sacheonensis]|nr:hypothetical protein [Paenibacillus sacheonensis]